MLQTTIERPVGADTRINTRHVDMSKLLHRRLGVGDWSGKRILAGLIATVRGQGCPVAGLCPCNLTQQDTAARASPSLGQEMSGPSPIPRETASANC